MLPQINQSRTKSPASAEYDQGSIEGTKITLPVNVAKQIMAASYFAEESLGDLEGETVVDRLIPLTKDKMVFADTANPKEEDPKRNTVTERYIYMENGNPSIHITVYYCYKDQKSPQIIDAVIDDVHVKLLILTTAQLQRQQNSAITLKPGEDTIEKEKLAIDDPDALEIKQTITTDKAKTLNRLYTFADGSSRYEKYTYLGEQEDHYFLLTSETSSEAEQSSM